jgi:trimethylamine--corrinoid protein Co-methyltransferase
MPDAQAAHEFTLTAMLPALAGTNLIYGIGMLDSGLTWDYAQAVMQNEMVRMVKKSIQGIPITDESIAYDVIKEVGPGGEYITHKHTFQNMRQQSQVDLFNRRTRDAWINSGSREIVDLAYEKAVDIIDNYKVPSIGKNAQANLDTIFDEAENKNNFNKKAS